MKKVNNSYKCETCGVIFDGHKKMKKHEKTCRINKLDRYIPDVKNVWNLEAIEPEKKDSKQLNLGESVAGKCHNCDSKLTSKDRVRGRNNLYECKECENINRF